MKEVSIIGVDLAKNSFQLHGASADGAVVFRKKLSRSQLLKFLAAQAELAALWTEIRDVAKRANAGRAEAAE
jgi:hypothetical protein